MKSLEKSLFAKANLKLWGEKIDFLDNYLTVTKSLTTKSSLDDLPEILTLLNQRQEIIRAISSLDKQGRGKPGNIMGGENIRESASLSILQRLKKILGEIEYLDNKLKEKFIAWKEEIKKELRANQLTSKTLHAYAQTFAYQFTPRFLDLRR